LYVDDDNHEVKDPDHNGHDDAKAAAHDDHDHSDGHDDDQVTPITAHMLKPASSR